MAEQAELPRAQSSAEPAEPSASGRTEPLAPGTAGATAGGGSLGQHAATATPPSTAAATAEEIPAKHGDSSGGATGGGIWTREFSEEGPDGKFHFQIVKLSQQLYVWVGLNTASHGNVYAAIPTRFDPMPLVTPLIGGGAEGASSSMAARLSKRLGCAVILASNIPPNAPMTEATAERLLIRRLPALLAEQSPT
ncbi:hypothetical protein CLOM_g15987 [Closterium sp. NIES-68]|nr:hypothetical protein CLOM_g15987 [Closterium sp. NIES-68]GJP66267.1 hypothetical protein CLOP_g23158 [Closterium sp. NIES-67]